MNDPDREIPDPTVARVHRAERQAARLQTERAYLSSAALRSQNFIAPSGAHVTEHDDAPVEIIVRARGRHAAPLEGKSLKPRKHL